MTGGEGESKINDVIYGWPLRQAIFAYYDKVMKGFVEA